ncbi:exopolysaccharide biosynthesis protein [Solilutibacter silvestris]|uniref:Putative ABC-type transport system permease component n=1 Tax=Solilutibacter silvestris TaxID=1645665 RepID=A0A2K1PY13_9GAMM|nr:exopolysaccharide biosynthesis protein [Lysobacter silvestris]PNS07673.1 putative ABC-type transport system permease component [Lysobacter silvestris]
MNDPRHEDRSTRALLQALADGDSGDTLTLRGILDDFDERGFGMLLLIATLPAFIPIPVGGAISGPLVMFLGAQLLFGRKDVWLPNRIANWGPRREAFARFAARMSPWLGRLEHLIKPRIALLFDHPLTMALSGILLVITGALLALPIPATNYVFGGILLMFALALLEQDGVLLIIAWIVAIVVATIIGLLSGHLLANIGTWLESLQGWWNARIA